MADLIHLTQAGGNPSNTGGVCECVTCCTGPLVVSAGRLKQCRCVRRIISVFILVLDGSDKYLIAIDLVKKLHGGSMVKQRFIGICSAARYGPSPLASWGPLGWVGFECLALTSAG